MSSIVTTADIRRCEKNRVDIPRANESEIGAGKAELLYAKLRIRSTKSGELLVKPCYFYSGTNLWNKYSLDPPVRFRKQKLKQNTLRKQLQRAVLKLQESQICLMTMTVRRLHMKRLARSSFVLFELVLSSRKANVISVSAMNTSGSMSLGYVHFIFRNNVVYYEHSAFAVVRRCGAAADFCPAARVQNVGKC